MAELRKCLGSARFGIEAHEAPPADFPIQPSQKDGLGRMCKPHWNQYTAGLAKARKAAPTSETDVTATTPEPIGTKPPRAPRKAAEPLAENPEAGVA